MRYLKKNWYRYDNPIRVWTSPEVFRTTIKQVFFFLFLCRRSILKLLMGETNHWLKRHQTPSITVLGNGLGRMIVMQKGKQQEKLQGESSEGVPKKRGEMGGLVLNSWVQWGGDVWGQEDSNPPQMSQIFFFFFLPHFFLFFTCSSCLWEWAKLREVEKVSGKKEVLVVKLKKWLRRWVISPGKNKNGNFPTLLDKSAWNVTVWLQIINFYIYQWVRFMSLKKKRYKEALTRNKRCKNLVEMQQKGDFPPSPCCFFQTIKHPKATMTNMLVTTSC